MSEEKSPYGPVIINGVLQYTSASSLTTFDPNSYGGCNRKYFFEKVQKRKQPQTAAMLRGTKTLHEPIEHYYKTGVEAFPPLVMSGRRYIYPRALGLLIEHEISHPLDVPQIIVVRDPNTGAIVEEKRAPIDLTRAPVRADGVPIVGKMDLTRDSIAYINEHGDLVPELHPNTIEFNDWKSTGDEAYAKTAQQLREAIQMITYGKYGVAIDQHMEWARLSHTYFLTGGKANAWKATITVPREEIERRWEYVDGLTRSMRDVVRESDPDKVPANTKSCNAYGRKGCPHKEYCSAGRFSSLTSLFGEAGAAALLAQQSPEQKVIPTMSILQRVNPGAALAATAIALPTVTPQNTPTHVGVNLTLGAQPTPGTAAPTVPAASMLDALEAEDAASAAIGSTLTSQVRDAFGIISLSEMGMPTFSGTAATLLRAYGAVCSPVRKYEPGDEIKGSGRLAGLANIDTLDKILALANDLKAHSAKKTVQHIAPPIAVLPPEVPASNPALAALPVEGFAMPSAPATPTVATFGNPPAVLVVAPAPSPAPAPAPSPVQPQPAAAKRKGRPPKATPAATESAPATAATSDETPFELYIDCIPSEPFESLDPFIAAWCAGLVNFFKSEADLPDVRTLEDKRMAFGKWKGGVAALVRESLVEGKVPRARFVVNTRGNEINTEVAAAMISARYKGADGTDGTGEAVLDLYVRGV